MRQRELRLRRKLSGRGLRSENIIQKTLEILEAENKIRGFVKSDFLDDIRDKDFFVVFCGKSKYHIVPLQVKTSITGQTEHQKIHPEIPSIKVRFRSLAVLKKKIMEVAGSFERGEVIHV